MNICVYGAASSLIDKSYIESGKELGRKIVERGHKLVFGGGTNGMMGAVAVGADEANGHITGIVPKFFKENNAEISYKHCTEYIYTETMSERKALLYGKSDALIVTPGGIGTLDEFFEVLTLKQLGRHKKAIVIYNINNFYDDLDKFMKNCIESKFITEECKDLYVILNTADEVLDYIENYNEDDLDFSNLKIR